MNPNIQKLCNIAEKEERRIVGLMSGTSLDGLDIVLCSFKGHGTSTKVKQLHFTTIPYTKVVKDEIRMIFSKELIELQQLCVLNPWIGILHGKMVLEALRSWNIEPDSVDLIASHGQTVYHAPKTQHGKELYPNSTLQIGDGDHVAVTTGIITISDFRQKHVAAGGEGAPLALFGDYLLFLEDGQTRIMLNIGGIANFTCLSHWDFFATDTGPGNTLLDHFARELYDLDFDRDSLIAKSGNVVEALLSSLKGHPFFTLPLPKSTGPETFSAEYVKNCQIESETESIQPADLMRTLTRFSAETIAESILKLLEKNVPKQEEIVYTSGGGNHNPLLIGDLKELLPEIKLDTVDILEISGDAKEAILFATLANEALCGTPEYYCGKKDLPKGIRIPNVSMGKFSFPS
jgi:anhydro-N-acetylmuramic acid kinase